MIVPNRSRRSFRADRRGITALEYALTAGFIGAALVYGMARESEGIAAAWQIVMNCFP